MGLLCRINYTGKIANVYNEDGTPSMLYQRALEFTGDQQEALNIWATSTLEEFEQATGKVNNNDDVTFEETLRFYNTLAAKDAVLSSSELFEVKQFMANNNVRKLSTLSDTLTKIFRKDGNLQLDVDAAIASGLYNAAELAGIDVEQMSDIMDKIEGQLLKSDITVEPNIQKFEFTDSGSRTILGNFEKVSEDKIYNDLENLIDDLSSSEEFYRKVGDLDYASFVEKFYTDKAFAQSVIDKFKGLKKVPVLQFEGDKLTVATSNTFNTVKNTIRTDVDAISVEADFDYLSDIDQDIWDRSEKEIRGILTRIEKDMIGMGIDVIGLKDKAKDRQAVLDFMSALNKLTNDAADGQIGTQSIKDFSQAHDNLIPKGINKSTERLPEKYKDLSIVKVYSALSDEVLFEEYGLLKVDENLYHKIKRENKDDIYEYLYQEVISGNLEIDSRFKNKKELVDPLNKTKVLEDLTTFISKRDTGLNIRNNEEVSLYQVAFEHSPLSNTKTDNRDKPMLSDIKTNPDYLKTEFVSDFYQYMLEEKFKDSLIWRETLSKFQINDKDIVLVDSIENVDDLKYAKELKDYFRLKKDSNVKYLVPSRQSGIEEDILHLNNLENMSEYTGKDYSYDSGYVITAPNTQKYIKFRGKLYEKALQNDESHLYAEVLNPPSNLYYNVASEIKYDKTVAKRILALYNKAEENKPVPVSTEELYEKAGMNTPFMQLVKQKFEASVRKAKQALNNAIGTNFNVGQQGESSTDKVFEKNLVEFIREKGIQVVTDPTEVKRVLAESGIEVNPMVAGFIGTGTTDNVIVSDNSVTIKVNPNSTSLKTIGNVRKANEDYAEKIKAGLRRFLGERYQASFVSSFVASRHAGTTIKIPQEVWDSIEQEREFNRIVKEAEALLKSELNRGVSRDVLRDLGYNFLQTPAGNVLGFEKNGVIYLDEAQLNNTTTLHELVHVWISMNKTKAERGDEKAQQILKKRKEVFQPMTDFWIKFWETDLDSYINNGTIQKIDC
jgi:hypothetical protein